MKYLMFLIVVGVTTAAIVPPEEPVGKKLPECRNRNSMTNTHNVRHETNCHQFYKCLGGYGFVIDCPTLKGAKLVFNEKSLVCDWEGVPCSDDDPSGTVTPPKPPTSSTTSTTSTTTKSPVDPGEPDCTIDSNRKKPHKDCHKFYYCVNGKPVEGECLNDTNFNPIIAECDYIECKN